MATQTQIVYRIVIAMGIGLFLIGLLGAAINDAFNITKEKVKCYDRFENEIVGLTCLKEKHNYNYNLIFLLIFLILSGSYFIILGTQALINERDKIIEHEYWKKHWSKKHGK